MNSIPSMITMCNLICGIISLILCYNGQFVTAAIFILVAMFWDMADGHVARMLKVSSEFGKELDSLADLVSFGVAPALLVKAILNDPLANSTLIDWLTCFTCIAFVLCGAYRLARFNILNIHEYYVGIPITLAGSLIAVVVLIAPQLPGWVFVILLFALSILMVSKLIVPKLTLIRSH